MYWKIAEQVDEEGILWYIYNYIEIKELSVQRKPWFNGFLRRMEYPINKELIIKAAMSDSEEAFESWYEAHKQL